MKIADATDSEINAAIARLRGWLCTEGYWHHPDKPNIALLCPPDYLHSWALCGQLKLIKVRIHIFEDGYTCIYVMPDSLKPSYGYQLIADEDTELRARCLAFLAMHFSDGMIEVDDEN